MTFESFVGIMAGTVAGIVISAAALTIVAIIYLVKYPPLQ